MGTKNNKIIFFPKQHVTEQNHVSIKIDGMLIVTLASVLVAIISLISTILIYKKSQVEFKPAVDIEAGYYEDEYYGEIYLNQQGKYIDSLTIKTGAENTEPIIVSVLPYYNIMYFDQKERTLIKQILPIYDMENISKIYAPLDVDNYNMKNGTITEIQLNDNSYEIIYDMMTAFDNADIKYNDFFYNIFDEAIITSIDLEFYVDINYKDIYQNNYKEVYLCQTGFRNFSGYLTDFAFEENIDSTIIEYNMDCLVNYIALKTKNLDNIEYDAKIYKISNKDMFYSELNELYSNIARSPNVIFYTPHISNNLNKLIRKEYCNKQLLFFLNEKDKRWDKCK